MDHTQIIKYEDMKADPAATLAKVMSFIDCDFSNADIDKAVEFASFENLAQKEKNSYFSSGHLQASDSTNENSLKVRKGKIGGWGSDWANRGWYGALQSDQNPNDIQDWDAVWEKAREHRDLVLKYWSSGAELMDLLAKEEIYVTEAWSGRVAALRKQGHPIGYIDPVNGLAWMESMFVLKGSPMAEAEELLNFMLDPKTALAVAEGQNYPSSLDPTKVEMNDAVKALPAFDPTGTLAGLVFRDPNKWLPVEKEQTKKWNRVKKGG